MPTNAYVITKEINDVSSWRAKTSLLDGLDIELTERCNNNCIHCCINLPQDDMDAKNKELSGEEIKNILKEAKALGCINVKFTGGEPLLREDFAELYLFARRLGLRVSIFTNAILITPKLADLFVREVPLEGIEITVYGMKKRSYEAVTRTAGSFEAAWRGINLLLEKRVPFVVKTALLPPNKEEIIEFEKWAATIPWMIKPPSYALFFDLRCRREEEKNEGIRRLRLSAAEGLKVLTRRKDNYIKEMKGFCAKFVHPPGEKLFSCGSGLGSGCVDAYGVFQPCLMLRHPDCLYNLKTGSLKDAKEKFFPKMREKKANNPDYLKRCANCFLKGLCEQCPAKSWAEHGTLDTPVEYLCEIAHTQARFLGLIRENEKAWEIKNWKKRISNFINR